MTAPLTGLRVLDLTRLLPGGFCTLILADLGADVLKIEEPGKGDYVRWMQPQRDGVSAGHLALNRGKKSMTLDLKKPRGVEILRRLVENADVLVESFRPGVMERLGAGYEVLAKDNPALVYCAITGYGREGPYAQRAGHDVNYLGYAGVLDVIGPAGGAPVIPGVQIADLGGGALPAAIGILAAVSAARTTGAGRYVDISMFDGAYSWLSFHATSVDMGAEEPERGRMRLSGGWACYGLYRCADGRYLSVGALEPQFFAALCRAVGTEDLIERQYDETSQSELRARLEEVFQTKTMRAWLDELEGLDACVGPVLTMSEAMADPHAVARGLVVQTPQGRAIAGPLGPGEAAAEGAPGFGQHTDEVLAALGFDPGAIWELRSEGVL